MAVSEDLMLAVLAMDAYNRGYNAGVNVVGDQVGMAQLGRATNAQTEPEAVAASFFAQAYTWNGRTIISYRGTDVIPYMTGPFFQASSWQDIAAWATFLNAPYSMAQHELAATFYQSVLAEAGGNPIETTGHSLGGALAGFIAGTYGLSATMFDNINFIDDVNNLYTAVTDGFPGNVEGELIVDGAALDHYFDGQTPTTPPTFPGTRFDGYYITGEVADLARSSEESALLTGLNFGTGSGLGNVALHSQALLVMGLFARDNGYLSEGENDWVAIQNQLFPSLANGTIATSIGLMQGPSDNPDSTGVSEVASQMQTMIAYSAIDEGERPFGDTAIRAMFDDANRLRKYQPA